jgi:hypothetical protein
MNTVVVAEYARARAARDAIACGDAWTVSFQWGPSEPVTSRTYCYYDALGLAKDAVFNRAINVSMVGPKGQKLDAEAIQRARY